MMHHCFEFDSVGVGFLSPTIAREFLPMINAQPARMVMHLFRWLGYLHRVAWSKSHATALAQDYLQGLFM
jgi:hypothetical protein